MTGAPFNILFTCVGRRVALLRAFRRAMDDLGLTGKLVGTDMTHAAAAMQIADCREIIPPVNTLHYIPALRELVARHAIRLVVPLTDLDLRTLSRHAEEFAAMGCQFMVGGEDAIAHCRDKLKFNAVIRNAGLRLIRSCDIHEFRQNPFFPCFDKPLHGSSAVGSGRLRNDREMRAHIATFGDLLMFQDYVPGQEYTIDVFRRRDGVVCAVVPRQRLAVRSGEVEKGITVNDPQLIDSVLRLVEQLPGMWGVFNAQCRRPIGGVPHFFEVNARFGGGVTLSIQAGADMPKMLLMELLGQPPEPRVGQFTDRLMMMRYDEAIFTVVDDPSQLPGFKEPISR